jgi:hypothetical protein
MKLREKINNFDNYSLAKLTKRREKTQINKIIAEENSEDY